MDIDVIDIVAIDDKAPAYTDKQVAVGAKLFPNHILHLPELEREHSRLVVEAKVATPSECKYRLFVEMYEICRKMYELFALCLCLLDFTPFLSN